MSKKPACDDHRPQTKGFPWEHPQGLSTWCPNCGALEINGEYMGKAKPDPDGGPEDWLFQPPLPLKWISVAVGLPKGVHLSDEDLAEIAKVDS